ncbi:SRPBCC family protein [Kribbella sp. NPDC056951]|uniref:SRPBCC family protein n=1 Tax=Kribbella sp. NPDC056951 TaxID=3345978 RepID=UPI00363DCEAE
MTDISATPATVWRVLTDVRRFAEWHPTLTVDGEAPELRVGAVVSLRLGGGAAGEQKFEVEIVQLAPERLLVWEGGTAGVFFGEHSFELEVLPDGVRLVDVERFTGSMAESVISENREALEREYRQVGWALKEMAEKLG